MKALLRSSVRRPAWLNNCREAVGTAMLKEDVPLEDALPFEQIPGPRPLPVIGTLYKYLPGGGYSFSRITECHTKMYRKYGPIVKEQLGPVTTIRLFDVKDVEKLLRVEGKYPRRPLTDLFLKHARDTGTKPSMVAAQGPEWHRQRYAVQRDMVSPQSVSAYIPAQEEVATALAEVVRNARNERGDVMEIAQYYYMYALEAIGLVCYDRRLGVFDVTEENKHNHHGYQVMLHAKTIFDNVLPMMNKWFLVERGFCKKQYQTYLNAVNGLLQATYGFMEEAERSGDTEKETLLNKLLKNEKVSREDVALIMMNLLGGGVESTGFTLAHMTYLLAKNPDKQEALYEELRRELPPGQPVTHEMLGRNLKYLRATLREVNRVSPAAAMSVLRVLDHDEVFGGYRVPAGCLLFVENTVMGMLPEYFEEPWKFEPERWLNRDINKTAAYIVLPFGHGPRSCVGRRFAEQELYLATIKLIQNFRIEYDGPNLGLINKTFQELDGPLNVRLIDRH